MISSKIYQEIIKRKNVKWHGKKKAKNEFLENWEKGLSVQHGSAKFERKVKKFFFHEEKFIKNDYIP